MLRFILTLFCISVAALIYCVRFSVPDVVITEVVITEVEISSGTDTREVMQVAAEVKPQY